MFALNAHAIRVATDKDASALRRLAELDGGPPLSGRALIGQIGGAPAAALSLGDGRVVADPSRATDHLVALLRMRAKALQAFDATPSLRERLVATFRHIDPAGAAAAPTPS